MVLHEYGTEDQNLLHLWTSIRLVSIEFKHVVEDVFAKRHLPSTFLYFAQDVVVWDLEDTNDVRKFYDWEAFGCLGVDEEKAVFASGKPWEDSILSELDARTQRDVRNLLVEPSHFVRVRGRINDTPLSGMTVDKDKRTLQVDWRQLFSIFFAEEKLFAKLLEKTVS